MLDLIKDGYGENLSDVEDAARYFVPYLNFNYVLRKYLKIGLRKCNLLVEADMVVSSPNKKKTNELLSRLAERVNDKILELSDAYSVIVNILQKSGINRIEVLKENDYESIGISHSENKIIDLIMSFDYAKLRAITYHNEFIKRMMQFYSCSKHMFIMH
ncbi:MAG: hypothetical protein K2N95_17690 [Lachnospiraceae bacterium]|nr:hypothetical protein [Lachnospiraceae bacterium]